MSYLARPPATGGSLNLQSLYVNSLKLSSQLIGDYSTWKLPVVTVSAANIILSGEQTISDVSVVNGDRVLVNGQTNGIENGIYIASADTWSRASDLPVGSYASGSLVAVNGTTDIYICTTALNVSLVGTNQIFFEVSANSLAPALQSIANLSTISNQMLYTLDTNVYNVTSLTAAGRSFLSASTTNEQQSILSLVPGTNVQEHSSILDNIVSSSSTANRLIYTTGVDYATTEVTSFIRSNVLNAANSTTLATNLGYLIGDTISTTGAIIRVTGTNEVTETGILVDPSDNITGINDLQVLGNITLTGNLDNITPAERTQLANINSVTIDNTQWNYLGSLDQSLSTSDSPRFSGLDLSSNRITNVLDPVSAQDAATKSYVDTVAATGSTPLQQVQLATSTVLPNTPTYASPAQTLTSTGGPGTLAIDGVTVSVSNRILVKNQAANTQNGVYIVTDDGASPGPNWVLTRSSDFNQAAMPKSSGTSVFVEINGSAVTNSGSTWALETTVNTVDPLTDPVTWVQIGGQQTFSAGSGIDAALLALGTITTDITSRLKYTTNSLDLNTVTVPYGGTGNTTLTSNGVLIGQGAAAVDTSKVAPSGNFVGDTDSQALTNKTLTNASNNIIARELWVNSGLASVSTYAAAVPTSGQVLTATSGTTATWQSPSTIIDPDRTLFVYQSANDVSPNWTTLGAAITDASSLIPTAANPVLILIYPGTYAESIPLTIPAYVAITSDGNTRGPVTIKPTAPASATSMFIVSGNATLSGMFIDGYDGTGAYANNGIYCTGGSVGTIDNVNNITVRNCSQACIRVTGNGTQYSKILLCKNISCQVTVNSPFVCDYGLKVDNGGLLSGNDLNATGFLSGGGVMTTGLLVEDAYSYSDIVNLQISSTTNGVQVGGGTTPSTSISTYPFTRLSTVRFGLISGTVFDLLAKSNIEIYSSSISDDTGIFPNRIDFKNTSPALPNNPNQILAENISVEFGRLSLYNGATNNPVKAVGLLNSLEYAEPQFFTLGKLVVGTPLQGYEFVAGEGNSHVLGMVSFIDDGGVFTNITTKVNYEVIINELIDCNVATTTAINLSSAPATIDGITPTSGVTRVLVKDGSTANPGTTSIDNGIYLWNGTGAAMTRTSDFGIGDIFSHYTFFYVANGDINYGSEWKIDASTFAGSSITVGTTAFGLQEYSSKLFPDPPVNDDAWYVGNVLPLKFPGLKTIITAPLEVSSGTGRDAIAWEFWNGSSWTNLNIMTTKSGAPYTSFCNQSLGYGDSDFGSSNNISYQIRFGEMDTWSTTTVNGVNGYWIRVRVIDASIISQVPVLSRVKLHTNRSEINEDGFMEYFGVARAYQKYCIFNLVQPGSATGLSNPSNKRIVPIDSGGITVSQDRLDISFSSSGTTTSSFVLEIPPNACTSCFFKCKVTLSSDDSAAGNAVLAIYYGFTINGNTIGDPNGTPTATGYSTTSTVAIPGSRAQTSAIFNLDYSMVPQGSLLWIQFVRLGSNVSDTYSGSIHLLNITVGYRTWCNGEYTFV